MIRPPAPPPIPGSYGVFSDSVVEQYPEHPDPNKRSSNQLKTIDLQPVSDDSVEFQGFLNNLAKSVNTETTYAFTGPPLLETEGFGYVSFGTELNAPSLTFNDLPNLPPLPPEEVEFLREIQRDARELGRLVSHHKIQGEPQMDPDEMDTVSDASIDVSAEDFIVFDRSITEIPEPREFPMLIAQKTFFFCVAFQSFKKNRLTSARTTQISQTRRAAKPRQRRTTA